MQRVAPPVLLVHGDADTRVPVEQSLMMQGALPSELCRAGRRT